MEHGAIKIKLDELMEKEHLSIKKLSEEAEMQRWQVRRYCKNEITRLDTAVLARLCRALNCSISDLLEYIPPEIE